MPYGESGNVWPARSDPGRSLKAVTPDDVNNLPDGECRGLWVGVGGDIAIVAADDPVADEQILKNVPSGYLVPIATIRVYSTGTTAASIVAIY